jgi:hypothetical protein
VLNSDIPVSNIVFAILNKDAQGCPFLPCQIQGQCPKIGHGRTFSCAHNDHLPTLYKLRNCSKVGRSRWPCVLRRRSAAAWLMGLRDRIPPGTWMFVCCEYCALCRYRPLRLADRSFRGVLPFLYVCLIVFDLETSTMRWRRRVDLGLLWQRRRFKVVK